MGRLRTKLKKAGAWATDAVKPIGSLPTRDLVAAGGLTSVGVGIAMIYLPAALICVGALVTVLAVASEPRRRK